MAEPAASVGDEVQIDLARGERIGLEEVVYAAGKSVDQLRFILHGALERGGRMFVTRLGAAQFDALPAPLRHALDYCPVSATAWIEPRSTPAQRPGPARIAIVAAGSSDVPMAREAQRTLAYHGEATGWFADVGVAGLWRLTRRLDAIRAHPVVIVAAGMDAALPTVLGGLIGSAIVGLPTSVGYGVAAGGRSALESMLASCAPGIAVVNIDNGYGAACAALRIVHAVDLAVDAAARSSGAALATEAVSDEVTEPADRPSRAKTSPPRCA